jgi:predicted dehydrogenase
MEEIPLPDVKSDWSEYYRNIVDVLDNGAELIVKPEQALRVMKVIDLAFRASEENAAIRCNI